MLQASAPPAQMLESAQSVANAGRQSGKFLYVNPELETDLAAK